MQKTNFKGIFFFSSLIMLVFMIYVSMTYHTGEILGVEFVNKDEYDSYTYDENIIPTFTFNGLLAPVDHQTRTIYISQNITQDFTVEQLKGTLSIEEVQYDVKLVNDDKYKDLYHAMKENYKFKVLVLSSNDKYTLYHIVFTSLPVVILDGDYIGNNEEGKAAYSGQVYVFNSLPNENNGYKVESCAGDWHVRGKTAAQNVKKPYKLTLKNKKGNNKSLSLLELGSDDDWILNPLNMDDLKIREKVCMDLWSQMSQTNSSNSNMSSGEYVEVIRNDTYLGIYLLQRRVDQKYLKLDHDLLVNVNDFQSFDKSLEIKYSDTNLNQTKQFIDAYFNEEYLENMDIDNFIDVNILTQFASLYDNRYKNRFLLVEDYYADPITKIILWDTDMSFGLRWNNGFSYDLQYSITGNVNQHEYDQLIILYPDLITKISHRYHELREHVLNSENINSIAKSLYDKILITGVIDRDQQLYGTCYNGEDTIDHFYQYVNERLRYLDNYYK